MEKPNRRQQSQIQLFNSQQPKIQQFNAQKSQIQKFNTNHVTDIQMNQSWISREESPLSFTLQKVI
jgi:hypothetical protein